VKEVNESDEREKRAKVTSSEKVTESEQHPQFKKNTQNLIKSDKSERK
jgi:hypothetical protein